MMETTKNRAIAEQVFDYMISIGYTPYDISFGCGYFIFDMGEDSVVHFRVKGVSRHWLFGMWIRSVELDMDAEQERKEREYDGVSWEDRAKVVQLFAQYDTCIDKFKPSRSDLLVDISAINWLDYIVRDFDPHAIFWEIDNMLGSMRHHPLMCYAGVLGAGGYQHYFPGSFLWYFLKYEGRTKFVELKKRFFYLTCVPWTYLKCAIASRASCVDHIRIENHDKENPGWTTSYKYGVWVTFAEGVKDEELDHWIQFWFHKTRYGKYDYYDYMVELRLWQQVGREGYFSFMD